MIIYLTGLPGVGKTSIGKELSGILKTEFIDLDQFIEREYGKTIPTIFEEEDEFSFRMRESEALRTLAESKKDLIIALGGGTMCELSNCEFILHTGVAVYLKSSPEEIAGRNPKLAGGRPLFSKLNEAELVHKLKQLLFIREPFYANSQVETLVNSGFSTKKLAMKLKLLTNRSQSL